MCVCILFELHALMDHQVLLFFSTLFFIIIMLVFLNC
jgi:hypothetical protein